MGFHKYLNLIGIKTNPRLIDIMLYATNQKERIQRKKTNNLKNHIKIRTNSFGDIFIPNDMAQKALVLGFLP